MIAGSLDEPHPYRFETAAHSDFVTFFAVTQNQFGQRAERWVHYVNDLDDFK
jgi:sarcosine oxidase delta subunit